MTRRDRFDRPRAGSIVRRACFALAMAWMVSIQVPADVLRGPYVVLEDAQMIRIRFEVDRPDDEVTLLHGGETRSRVVPAYARGTRDTFIAEVAVDLSVYRAFRGYEIGRPGQPATTYAWHSRINGELKSYPRLLVFGDSQGGAETLAKLGRQWAREEFDLMVGLGDLADAGSRYESWHEEFFAPLRDLLPHYPLLPICGNHDSYRGKSLEWFDWYFGRGDRRRYFRIDFGDLRLIGLNNSDVHTKYGFDPIDPLTPQYDFLLESALGAGAAGRKLAFFSHIPLFSGSTVVNAEFGSELQRKYVLPILERARVLGFFAGHHHKFERIARPGLRNVIQHIVTGGAGGRLFTAARERGGFPMDREIFEVYHYLTVDFSGGGVVVARALGGEEIDRVAFGTAAKVAATSPIPELWRASITDELTLSPGERLGHSLALPASRASVPTGNDSTVHAQLRRTDGGLVGLVQNLDRAEARTVSLQGYDWPRKAWSYLQGGTFVIPVAGIHGRIALVTINGANVSPLDRCFPVLHWPLAGARAGITETAGAAMLLKGGEDFELNPEPGRLLAKWSWGERKVDGIAPEQRARQWALMESPPAAPGPTFISRSELVRWVAGEARPEGYLVQPAGGRTVAVLVHWPRFQCLAIVAGETLAGATGSIFVSTGHGLRIETAVVDGASGLRVRRTTGGDLFVPINGGRKGSS
jgi:hypothetical protein